MTPTYYFVGGELDDFDSGTGVASNNTTAGNFRATHCRAAVQVNGDTSLANHRQVDLPEPSRVWVTARHINGSGGSVVNTAKQIRIKHSTDKEVRIGFTSSATNAPARLYHFDGSSESILATSSLVSETWAGVLRKVDVLVEINGGGNDRVELHVDGVEHVTWTGDLGASTGVQAVQFRNNNSGTSTGAGIWSEIIISDTDTRPMGLATLELDGDGNHTDWTGAYTDINALAINDATEIATSTAGAQASFTLADLHADVEENVWAVIPRLRAIRGASGPQSLSVGARSGGATTYAASGVTLPTAYGSGVIGPMHVNPVSGGYWTRAVVDGAEVALRANA